MTDSQINATFKRGARVKVVKCDSYSRQNFVGTLGIVIQSRYDLWGKIEIGLDGEFNSKSATGNFYFKPYELEVVNETNTDNLEENIMENITNYLNIVRVEYVDDKKVSNCNYANFDDTIKKGDMVVVNAPYTGFELATVIEVVDRNDVETDKEVVCKVDTTAYDARVENRAKAAELKAKMKERAKQLQDIALYQMLAKDDPAMLELLSQYQAIPGM